VALDTRAPTIRAPVATKTGAAATPASPAAKPKGQRARGRALGTTAPHGKAAAPGQLKSPGSPAQGKALGATKQKAKPAKPTAAKQAHGKRPAAKRVHKAAKKPRHSAAKPAPRPAPAAAGQDATDTAAQPGKRDAAGKP